MRTAKKALVGACQWRITVIVQYARGVLVFEYKRNSSQLLTLVLMVSIENDCKKASTSLNATIPRVVL